MYGRLAARRNMVALIALPADLSISLMLRIFGAGILILLVIGLTAVLWFRSKPKPVNRVGRKAVSADSVLWAAPDSSDIASSPDAVLILYGRSLIVSTSIYFGAARQAGDGRQWHELPELSSGCRYACMGE